MAQGSVQLGVGQLPGGRFLGEVVDDPDLTSRTRRPGAGWGLLPGMGAMSPVAAHPDMASAITRIRGLAVTV